MKEVLYTYLNELVWCMSTPGTIICWSIFSDFGILYSTGVRFCGADQLMIFMMADQHHNKLYKYMCGIYLCALCESLPDHIIKLRTNFSRAKLIVKRIFLTIQLHNLKSHKV